MRLSRRTMSFLVFALTLACHDTTAPERTSAGFVLQSINGQPLPVVLFSDATRTLTVVSSILTLTMDGHAFIGEVYTQDSQGIVTQPTFTATLDYRLHGDQIEIGSFTPCPPNALCAANATGTLANGTLTLNNPLPAPNKIYFYRTGPLL
jgi:hypothetical protein